MEMQQRTQPLLFSSSQRQLGSKLADPVQRHGVHHTVRSNDSGEDADDKENALRAGVAGRGGTASSLFSDLANFQIVISLTILSLNSE